MWLDQVASPLYSSALCLKAVLFIVVLETMRVYYVGVVFLKEEEADAYMVTHVQKH